MTTLHADLATRSARPAMTLKWVLVLMSLSVATVIDGVATFNVTQTMDRATSEQAAITLPSDRCAPGCTIMMASNQPANDRVQ